jgi:hypothetical protein
LRASTSPVIDTRQVTKYSLFILEVVKAHVAVRPKYPETIHGQISQAVQKAKFSEKSLRRHRLERLETPGKTTHSGRSRVNIALVG